MKRYFKLFLLFFIMSTLFFIKNEVRAAVSVGTLADLEDALSASGTNTITLTGDITITRELVVRATKTINGGGYSLRRNTPTTGRYLGDLIVVGSSSWTGNLTLNNVTINGTCNSTRKAGGRLLIVTKSGSRLTINSGATLQNNTSNSTTTDAGGAITINNGCSVTMAGGTIQNNESSLGGGAVRINSGATFTMSGGVIQNNETNAGGTNNNHGIGGAIHNSGTFTMSGGSIHNNISRSYTYGADVFGGLGGAIYNVGGDVTIDGGSIYSNTSATGGGGIYSTGGTVKMSNGSIYSNSTDTMGGGIYINNGSLFTLTGGSIYNNTATTGGGVYTSKEESTMNMSGGYLFGNSANSGGGIRINKATFTMSGGVIGRDSAGAIKNNSSPLYVSGTTTITNGKIYNTNTVTAIHNTGGGTLNYNATNSTYGVLGEGTTGIVNDTDSTLIYAATSGSTSPSISDSYNTGVENRGSFTMNRGTLSNASNGLMNKKNATIINNSSITKINNQTGATLNAYGTSSFNTSFTNAGTVTQNAGTVSANLSNSGTVNQVNGTISGTVTNSGTLKQTGGTINNTITNTGTISKTTGTISGTINNNTNGTFTQDGGTVSGSVNNKNNYTLSSGSMDGVITNEDTCNIDGGSVSTRLINKSGISTMDGGTLSGTTCNNGSFILKSGTVTTSSTTVATILATNQSTMTLYGGTITNQNGVAISNKGTSLTIEGGNITANGVLYPAIESTANATIYGGTIKSSGHGIYQMEGDLVLGLGGSSVSPSASIVSGTDTSTAKYYDVYKDCADSKGKLTVNYNQSTTRLGVDFSTLYLAKSATMITSLPRHLYNVTTSTATHKITSPNKSLKVIVENYEKERVVARCNNYTYDGITLSASDFAKNEVSKMTLPNSDGWYLKASGGTIVIWKREYTVRFQKSNSNSTGTMSDFVVIPSHNYANDEKAKLGFNLINGQFEGWSKTPVVEYVTANTADDFGKKYGSNPQLNQNKIMIEGIYDLPATVVPDDGTITLYARWSPVPIIEIVPEINGEERLFYEDELNITDTILKMGLKATDIVDGDITNKIKIEAIVYKDRAPDYLIDDVNVTKLDTRKELLGKGHLAVSVTNSRGGYQTVDVPFTIDKNEAPELETPERYIMLKSIQDYTNDEILEKIKEQINITDDIDTSEDIMKNFCIVSGAFPKKKHGIYEFTVQVKDQYGHRFYMNAGEKKQYGKGKTAESLVRFGVYDTDYMKKGLGHVRFISKEYFPSTLRPNSKWRVEPYYSMLDDMLNKDSNNPADVIQEWHFTSEERKAVKEYSRTKNPYLKESREGFQNQFGHCRVK